MVGSDFSGVPPSGLQKSRIAFEYQKEMTMVERVNFQCCTCETRFACRTQFGHGREQVYIFPCPGCGVDVGYTLLIDQENASWSYEGLNNIEFDRGVSEPEIILSFSSNFLVEIESEREPDSDRLTPFMSNLSLVCDKEGFCECYSRREGAVKHLWPSLQRAKTHLDRADVSKFCSELDSTGLLQLLKSKDSANMREVLAEALERYWHVIATDMNQFRKRVIARIKSACDQDISQVEDLRRQYRQSGNASRLFDEIFAINRQWARMYPFFASLEVLDFTSKTDEEILRRYTLSEKPIDQLKSFYSDCFETLGRAFVLAAAYEGIASGKGLGIPSRKRLIPIDEFALTANGSKPDLIKGMPFWDIFENQFDSKLRNGIGHHSFRYLPSEDLVHYQNDSKTRGAESFSIPYLDFCMRTRSIYHRVTVAAVYVHSVWI